ncbi:hypothetical protein PAPYR_13358 [Paratrimastix pyriformis]|uniref:Uncharacterized protein n=1 Tax=Paratrimastix pyriformis TaxID=342808 RepID=A0ABQ8U0D3_9EUKA|nr:hypothetical protein PAPYR_13358 [Paratrimastix pyriformis]
MIRSRHRRVHFNRQPHQPPRLQLAGHPTCPPFAGQSCPVRLLYGVSDIAPPSTPTLTCPGELDMTRQYQTAGPIGPDWTEILIAGQKWCHHPPSPLPRRRARRAPFSPPHLKNCPLLVLSCPSPPTGLHHPWVGGMSTFPTPWDDVSFLTPWGMSAFPSRGYVDITSWGYVDITHPGGYVDFTSWGYVDITTPLGYVDITPPLLV